MVNKESKSIVQQIELLKNRGMQFRNEEQAFHFLSNISYYRLKGYWWDMQSDTTTHLFRSGSTFEEVLDRYTFDRHLRLVLFDAIERIEIALRTKLIYHLSQSFGGLFYLNNKLVSDIQLHAKILTGLREEFKRSQEIFAKDFHKKYNYHDPDAWLILEVASMGDLSKIFKNLNHQLPEKSKITNEMGLNLHNELSSWLEAITYVRNIIAHHSRLWSRNMVKKPMQLSNPKHPWFQNKLTPVQEKKPFLIISSMIYLCNVITPNHQVKNKILDLIKDNSELPIYKLGFLNNWENEPLWQRYG